MATVAHITHGDLAGLTQQGVATFRGVPYAQPPIGRLRFAPPVPAESWRGQRDTTRHGPIAPQAPSRLAPAMGDFLRPMDEDCLTLTIWSPVEDWTVGADPGRRPVVVWLHGGAWVSGAGSLDWYDGATLAREHGVVVVGVNYRLGALGYLKHPLLPVADPGTLDQIAALAWVRDHISAFGGDPGCVTVAGQSAGAASIGRLIVDPAARKLFHRAIIQSGGFGRAPLCREDAFVIGAQVIRAAGLDPDAPDVIERLRALPASALVEAAGTAARANARFAETNPPFMPTVPDRMSEAALFDAIAAGARGKQILIGATREEMHAFFVANPAMAAPDPQAVAQRFAALAGRPEAIERYRRRRPGGDLRDLLADLVSDHTFLWPTMRLAERLSAAGARVHAYQFDWSPQASPFRACHCIELPFVFGNFAQWPDAAMLAGGNPADTAGLSALMRAAWCGFARTGNPSLPGLDWPRYDGASRRTLRLDSVCGIDGDPAGLDTRAATSDGSPP